LFESYGQKKVVSPQGDFVKLPSKIVSLQDNFVKLAGEVKLIDSQYILILTLSVSGKNEITIDKRRYFNQGEYSIASNRLFLHKWIGKSYIHIYVDGQGHPMFSADWDKKIKVTKQNPIIDTLNIESYYPLEIGEYFIIVQEDYWTKSSKHFAQSNKIPFNVGYLPKEAAFD
jgi:hypothetical protein